MRDGEKRMDDHNEWPFVWLGVHTRDKRAFLWRIAA